jgi:hypothetical protein
LTEQGPIRLEQIGCVATLRVREDRCTARRGREEAGTSRQAVRCSPSEAEPIVSSRHDRLSEEGARADPAYFIAE